MAEQILDLNLGTEMPDGQRFTNAAYIEPGWVLVLPIGLTPAAADGLVSTESADLHVVERGETLWSIARDELGSPTRWPEVWEHNGGEVMVDGRVFDDPDLIVPGWELDLPVPPPTVPPIADAPPSTGTAVNDPPPTIPATARPFSPRRRRSPAHPTPRSPPCRHRSRRHRRCRSRRRPWRRRVCRPLDDRAVVGCAGRLRPVAR